jgi:hypothetical protein
MIVGCWKSIDHLTVSEYDNDIMFKRCTAIKYISWGSIRPFPVSNDIIKENDSYIKDNDSYFLKSVLKTKISIILHHITVSL